MTFFFTRLARLWRGRPKTTAEPFAEQKVPPAVPDESSLYHACDNVITHGVNWPAYEVASLMNHHGWTSAPARAVLHRVMQRMADDRIALPQVEKPSLAHSLEAARNHFGGSIREVTTDTYCFKDGRILTFRNGSWIAYENEMASAA